MVRNTNRHGHTSPSGLEDDRDDDDRDQLDDDRDDDQDELEDGESRDGDGGVRPVPPGVDDQDELDGVSGGMI